MGRMVREAPAVHHCRPPDPMGTNADWEFPDGLGRAPRLRDGVRLPHVGDVWECSCGWTWVLGPPARGQGYVSFVKEWRPETRFERWRRERRAS